MDGSPLFDGISDDVRAELRQLAVERGYASGESLFRQGEEPRHLFVLLSGRVKVWRTTEDGSVLTLTILGAGLPLGVLGAAAQRPSTATATALGPVAAAQWPIETMRRIMADDPQLAANVLLRVSDYAEQMIQRLDEISAAPVEQRLARTLLRLSQQGDAVCDLLQLSRQDLAELTSSTLPTISRIMSRWRGEGLVDGGRRSRIQILDRVGIKAVAESAVA